MRSPSDSWREGVWGDLAELEQVGQLAQRLAVLGEGDLVERPVELEGLGRREIPQQLLLLPHHQGDRLEELDPPLEGGEAGDAHPPGGGMQEAGEHLQGGGDLPGPKAPACLLRSPSAIEKLIPSTARTSSVGRRNSERSEAESPASRRLTR